MNRKNYIAVVLIVFSIGALIIILYPFILSGDLLKKDLQNYSALILAFLTFIYVLLTYFILRSNNRAVREQLRPYVIVTFPAENRLIYLSIKNIGQRPAYNVKIEISDGLEELQFDWIKGNYKYFLSQSFIAPQQEIKDAISDPSSIIHPHNKDAKKKFDFTISYNDSENNKYTLQYTIDFSTIYNEKRLRKDTEVDNLMAIHEEFQKLNKHFENYLEKQ